MDKEALKALLSGADLTGLLPDLEKLFGVLSPVLRWAVMAGPVCLLAMGLVYLFLAPKEANHTLGFRCWWGMSSVEVWQFTQRLAGLVWSGLGLVLTIVMAIVSAGWAKADPGAAAWKALKAVGWELGLVFASVVAINVTIIALFDGRGYRRRRNKF